MELRGLESRLLRGNLGSFKLLNNRPQNLDDFLSLLYRERYEPGISAIKSEIYFSLAIVDGPDVIGIFF